MNPPQSLSSSDYELDPVFLNSRREALMILGLWFLALMWTVPVCWLLGYDQEFTPDNIPLVMGMPAWTFWGIVVPWLAADVLTTVLCFVVIRNDPLGMSDDEREAAEAAGGQV